MGSKNKQASKNSRNKDNTNKLFSRWGGEITIKNIFKDGKMSVVAICGKTGKTARKPKDLM